MEQRTEKFKLEDFGEYLNQGNPDIKEKAYVWAAALGLQATDGLRTSYEMRRTARQYIEGRLTIDEVRQHINEYYKSNPPATTDKEKEQEADKVACNIADVLFNKRLDFSTDGYLNLHRQIFDGVYDHAGQLRATDIVKSEWVLEKDTVFYLHWEELRMALDSNFQFERNLHYDELNKEDLLEWIAFFTAGIWHIHPFNEGNTRTIAVFSILLAFIGKASALIQTIPAPVMGGVSFLLYGMIAASGLRLLVDKKVDYSKPRNLALTAVVFVTGLSGAFIQIGQVQLTGMCLATIVGMALGLVFYFIDKAGLANDKEE